MTDYLDDVLGKALTKDDDEDVDKDSVKRAAHEALGETMKGRRYIDDPSEAPEDAEVHEGDRGGMYYETEGTDRDTDGVDPDQGPDQQSPPATQDDFQSPGGSTSSGSDVEEAIESGEVDSVTINNVTYELEEDHWSGTTWYASEHSGGYDAETLAERVAEADGVDVEDGDVVVGAEEEEETVEGPVEVLGTEVDPEDVARKVLRQHPDYDPDEHDAGEAVASAALDYADTTWDEVDREGATSDFDALLSASKDLLDELAE